MGNGAGASRETRVSRYIKEVGTACRPCVIYHEGY